METINDDRMQALLDGMSEAQSAIDELFEKAMRISEGRYYLGIVDLEFTRNTDPDSGTVSLYRTVGFFRPCSTQQFAQYLSAVVDIAPSDLAKTEDQMIVHRLHMLAYSHFWECMGVQRLLISLARTALGCRYDPELFLERKPPSTALNWQTIRGLLEKGSFQLYDTISRLYHPSIRNAFAHSDFWIDGDWIFFRDPQSKREVNVPALKISTWQRLFDLTMDFTGRLFIKRQSAERKLVTLIPFPVDLPEFGGYFPLWKDSSGYWTTAPR